MIWANKSIGKGTARWMFWIHLYQIHLLWAFVAGILWKTQPWDISARALTAKCIASCHHDGSLEDDYCVPFELKFLIPTLCHMLCSPIPSHIYEESNLGSSVSQNKLEKYTFLWFKNRLLFLLGEKYKGIFSKNMLSSSLVDIVFLCAFIL